MIIGIKSILLILICGIILTCAIESAAGEVPDSTRDACFSRMFIAPTGRMLPAGVIGLSFGGAFASQGGKEYLGLFSIGLGGIAELEVSTSHIMTNVFSSSDWIGTTALKFTIFSGKPGKRLPEVMIALRSNRWSNIKGSGSELAGPADSDDNQDIERVEFKTHLTSLYISATSEITSSFTLHGGLIWYDVRTKDLSYDYSNINRNLPGDMKKSIVGLFGGVEHLMNSSTYSIFEFGSMPQIEFDRKMEQMSVTQLWYAMVGVRFFFTEMAAVDAGIRYRSDYSGLADAEIIVGINVGVDVIKGIKSSIKKR